jgi:hypothetical protein
MERGGDGLIDDGMKTSSSMPMVYSGLAYFPETGVAEQTAPVSFFKSPFAVLSGRFPRTGSRVKAERNPAGGEP